jgi:hypothetical protein
MPSKYTVEPRPESMNPQATFLPGNALLGVTR